MCYITEILFNNNHFFSYKIRFSFRISLLIEIKFFVLPFSGTVSLVKESRRLRILWLKISAKEVNDTLENGENQIFT